MNCPSELGSVAPVYWFFEILEYIFSLDMKGNITVKLLNF